MCPKKFLGKDHELFVIQWKRNEIETMKRKLENCQSMNGKAFPSAPGSSFSEIQKAM